MNSLNQYRFKKIIFYIIFTIVWFTIFLIYLLPRAEQDTWCHLKCGELILESRKVIHNDIFSYGKTTYWINHQWLAQVIFYLIYHKLGWYGLLLLKAILGIFFTYIIYKIILNETKNIIFTLFAILFFSSIISFWMRIRPQIFTYLFFTIIFYVIYIHKTDIKYYYFLPLVIFFWANLHNAFVSGLFIVYLYLFSYYRKHLYYSIKNKKILFPKNLNKLIIIVVLSTLLAFLNPNSYHIFIYPLSNVINREIFSYIPEWQTSLIYHQSLYPYYFLVLISLVTCILFWKEMGFFNLILILFFLLLSIQSRRHIPLFSIVSIPIISKYLYFGTKQKHRIIFNFLKHRFYNIIIPVILILLTIGVIFHRTHSVYFKKFDLVDTIKGNSPINAVEFIKLNELKGRIFNTFGWGGYLIFSLYPQHKVFIDGRFDTVYDRNYILEYFKSREDKEVLDSLLEKYKINIVLFPKNSEIANFLIRDKNWFLIYEDELAVIFIKNSLNNRDIIEKYFTNRLKYPESKDGYIAKGILLAKNRKFKHALIEFKKALKFSTGKCFECHYNIGLTYAYMNKIDNAITEWKKAAEINPKNLDVHFNLAQAYRLQRRFKNAIKEYETILKFNPNNKTVKAILDELYREELDK